MFRILLTYLIPLVAPFILWYVWMKFFGPKTEEEGNKSIKDAPWQILLPAGLVLAAITLVSLAVFSGTDTSNTYTPAEFRDGKIVPPQVVPRGD